MKHRAYLILFLLVVIVFNTDAQTDVLHLKSDVIDTFFGKPVPDPYRWLENLGSDSVKQWLQAQKQINKDQQKLFNGRYSTAISNITTDAHFRYTSDEKTGPYYFQMMASSDPYNPASILYYREDMHDKFDVAFNPNNIRGHNNYTIHTWKLSDNGRYLAVALSAGGSDWLEIRVHDMDKNTNLKDRVDYARFTDIIWWQNGFFYARYPHTDQNTALGGQELYYHTLGQSQDDDKLLMTIPASPGYGTIQISKTSNNRYLLVSRNQKISGKWYQLIVYKDLTQSLDVEWNVLVQVPEQEKAFFTVVDGTDSGFILHTNYKAPHGRVFFAHLDVANHFTEIVSAADEVIKSVTYVYHQVVVLYFTAGEYQVRMFTLNGDMVDGLKFEPGIDVEGFEGNANDSETIFKERTFYLPTMLNRYYFKTKTHSPVDKTHITYDAHDFETKVVHYQSKDGTDVPMYLTYKKGLKLKNNNPVLLYGYGASGIAVTPSFNPAYIVLFRNKGILAVPMVRGGSEQGDEWHNAGKGLNKQNTFDDFVAAAQYLQREGYTSKERLAIEGRSSGGLLVGAVITQHPDLCQVAVSRSGVFDMLRYPLFTGGKYLLGEFGNPHDYKDFDNLLSYSPLHNVKPGVSYPATLFITGRNDDRVPPFHTYKFLARLQECNTGSNPQILYFEDDAGHNGATGYYDMRDQEAFILAFMFTQMGLPLKYY